MPVVSDHGPCADFERALAEFAYRLPNSPVGYRWEADGGASALVARETTYGAWYAVLTHLEYDSAHFGLEEARLEPLITPATRGCLSADIRDEGRGFAQNVIDQAGRRGYEHITAPIDTRDSLASAALQAAGFTMVDTTVIYRLELADHKPARYPVSVRPACREDIHGLREIASACFGDRRHNANRFNCDPAFDPEKVAEMYAQWAERSVEGPMADLVLVYEAERKPAGFITVALDRQNSAARIPLNAVASAQQGTGIYTALVRAALGWLVERGAKRVEIRTQIGNMAVHRTWQRLGALLASASHTFSYRVE